MRPVALTILLVAAVAATGCVSAQGGGSVRVRPSLGIVATPPVTIRGTSFKAHERVTVDVVATGGRERKRTVANAAGAFRLVFRGLNLSACAGVSITAIGDRGSRAGSRRSPGVCPHP
jgi:hypothetical protein